MNREVLKATLRQAEGERAFVYDDKTGLAVKRGSVITGTLTVGVGRSLAKPLSAAAIDFLLEEDITEVEQGLDEQLPWWRDLDEVRQQTIAEMVFQLGIHGLTAFHQTLPAIERGDWEAAAAGMKASEVGRQCKGRWQRLADAMRTGEQRA